MKIYNFQHKNLDLGQQFTFQQVNDPKPMSKSVIVCLQKNMACNESRLESNWKINGKNWKF